MRRLAAVAFLAFAVALVDARQNGQVATDPQFRAGVNLVSIYATVLDETGRLVPDLTKDDFLVLDDGKPQLVTQFSNAVQPITVVVMIDRSVSLEPQFGLERAAAEAFIINLTPGDRARVGSCNSLIRIDPDGFTGDRDELIRILHLNLLDAGLTPLWNATASAMNALAREKGRRVVVLMSDGHNNTGLPGRHTVTFEAVRDRAQAEDIMIYTIGVTNPCGPAPASSGSLVRREPIAFQQRGGGPPPPPGGGPDGGGAPPSRPPTPIEGPGGPGHPLTAPNGPGVSFPFDRLFGNHMGEGRCTGTEPGLSLETLAADGGGGYLVVHPSDDLPAIFARLADELHHQYQLGFTIAVLDGRTHALEVRARDPKMHVRARTSYVAVKK
jgi:VWFA-related protein